MGRPINPIHKDVAGGGTLEQIDTAQKGGFPAAGGDDDRGDLAVLYRERDVMQYLQEFKALIHIHNWENIGFEDRGKVVDGLITQIRATSEYCRLNGKSEDSLFSTF